jgi:putative protease
VANNLGHFSLLRSFRPHVQVIAGPWLSTFNTWAFSFVASLGVSGIVSPLENNRQNLERTLQSVGAQTQASENRHANSLRSLAFVPVFAWPPLFHIRADLGSVYDFSSFQDSMGQDFSLLCDPHGSQVIPLKPFSIIDKIPFLKEAGFRRFIIDLSWRPLKKKDYKDLMQAVENGIPLPRASRFNWKNGFYKAGD